MMIVSERYDRLKMRISIRTWERIKAKAKWEGITLSAVICEYPDFIPKRLRKLANNCFVATRSEWLTERRKEVASTLRWIDRQLASIETQETR